MISSAFLAELAAQKEKIISPRMGQMGHESAQTILKEVQLKYELKSTDYALVIIALLFQQGGTSRSCDGNHSVTIFVRYMWDVY